MIYEFKNNILYLYQDGSMNIVQPFNPITGEKFENKDEALDWLVHYISSTYNAMPSKAKMNGVSLMSPKSTLECIANKITAKVDEPFSVEFNIAENCISADLKMRLIKLEEDINILTSSYKEYEIEMINSSCSKNLILDSNGQYLIWIEGWLNCDTGKKVLLQDFNAFNIEIF